MFEALSTEQKSRNLDHNRHKKERGSEARIIPPIYALLVAHFNFTSMSRQQRGSVCVCVCKMERECACECVRVEETEREDEEESWA